MSLNWKKVDAKFSFLHLFRMDDWEIKPSLNFWCFAHGSSSINWTKFGRLHTRTPATSIALLHIIIVNICNFCILFLYFYFLFGNTDLESLTLNLK